MFDAVKKIIKRVTSSGNTFDKGASQFVTMKYMGKDVTTQVMHDYGFCSSVPDGGIGICVNPRGEAQDRASFFFHPKYRIKDLKPGETIVGNFFVEATLFFDEKGRGVLTLPDDLIITCKNLTATVEGSATVKASSLAADISGTTTIKSADIILDGPVEAKKGLNVTGVMNNNGKDVGSQHKHEAGTLQDADGSKVSGNTGDPI